MHKDEIEQLIRSFKTHPWHLSFQGVALADFMRDCEEVSTWDVVIAEGERKGKTVELQYGDETLCVEPESRIVKASRDQISISGTKVRVGAGGTTKIGLSDEQRKEAERQFRETSDKPNVPDDAYLRIQRNPILFLHIVVVDREKKDGNDNLRTQIDPGCKVPDYLYALGIGIPAIGNEKIAYYMVNTVELRNYYNVEEDGDE